MPWWEILSIVLGTLLFLYVLVGWTLTWVFLRGKMRDEKTIRKTEIESNVPEEVFSYPYEEARLTNKRGLKMFGRVFIAPRPTDKWVLVLHGFSSNGVAMMKYGKLFNELGFNAVAPDFCHCGRSEGKYLSFGNYEARDAAEWLEMIKEKYSPKELGVFGVSMGAATAVHLVKGRKDVDFLIPYCSYESYKRIVISKGKDFTRIPYFDIYWPMVRFSTYIVAGKTDGKTLDVSKDLKEVSCPTLLLHSKKDNFTDFRNSVDIYRKNRRPNVKLHLFEKGLHARAFATDPKEYTRVVKKFIDEVESNISKEETA